MTLINEVCVEKYEARYVDGHIQIKDGAYYCYCAYVLRNSRYSGFLMGGAC